ncbi:MAG: ABC transporter permease [Candidatus Sulfopaludibacter sp.]|nr:ABC transporter permease [Candidatus Sulfopaludibacter sp.]
MKLIGDLGHAARSLVREPGFAVPAILMLGLGLGATSVVFSLVNGVLLKPLPYAQPDRLVSIREVIPKIAPLYPSLPVNARHFVEWRKSCPALESMSVFQPGTLNLTGWGEPERLDAAMVSANLFRVLRVLPARGRDFRDDEEQDGKDTVAILTDGLWRRRFHADPSLVGRTVSLNGRSRTVIGILAPDFRFPDRNAFDIGQATAPHAEVFVPKVFAKGELEQLLGTHNYAVIARLRPGASREQAVAQLEAVQARMESMAGEKVNLRALVTPLLETVAGKSRRGLMVLMSAIAALLLIICVNLANLLLARSERHSREFAVRAALGATRGALIRHGLAESLLLAFSGGLLAAGIAAVGIDLLKAYAPAGIPRLDEVALDGRVMAFAAALVAVTALLFGFLPAWRASRTDPQDTLRSATRGATASAGAMRLRNVLVATEVGLSAALLILAGMLVNSFVRLIRADKGFRAPTVLAVDIGLSGERYQPDGARDGFYRRLFAALSTQPGVQAAAISSALPLQGETWIDGVSANGGSSPEFSVNVRFVSPDYFRTMGIPLRAGRPLSEGDRGHQRAVISSRLAASLWPGQDPLGRRFTRGNNEWFEVAGVAGDVRAEADQAPVAMMYRGYWEWMPSRTVLVARAAGAPQSIAGALRAAIHAADPDVPAPPMRTMSEVLDSSVGTRRFQMLLAGGFALMALLVASFGIYAVVSYSVVRRTSELGIRAALGARSGDLYGLILWQGMAPVVAGLLAAAAVALAFGRVLSSLLYDMDGGDPLTIALVAALLGLVSLAACLIPARRASRLDPLDALRYQ